MGRTIFWAVMPCSQVVHSRFGGTSVHFHKLHGNISNTTIFFNFIFISVIVNVSNYNLRQPSISNHVFISMKL
jgi:hypothetical protein